MLQPTFSDLIQVKAGSLMRTFEGLLQQHRFFSQVRYSSLTNSVKTQVK